MNWNRYFFNLAKAVAQKSKDRSTKVGCVIVGSDNEIRSIGYNGFPRGVDDDVEARHERPTKYLYTEHAERNAIYNAARVGVSLKDCRLYISWFPCVDCTRAIIQVGIIEIVIDRDSDEYKDVYLQKRWGGGVHPARKMLTEAGVKVTVVGKIDVKDV